MIHTVHTNTRSVLAASLIPVNLTWSESEIIICTTSSFSKETFSVLRAEDKQGVYYKPLKPYHNGEFEIFFYFNCECCDFDENRVVLIRNRN